MKSRLLCIAAIGTLALAGCATTSPNQNYGYGSSPAYPSRTSCADCGIVTRIDAIASGRSAPSATGAILGGIVGAVAGHEISDKTGGSKGNQNISAAAGAAAGAVAGNAIQNRVTSDTYNIHVRMDDGRTLVVNQRDLGGVRENTYVRVVNGKVVIR
ncbi:peptidoglycan-associated outer membrane lipoprotein precursor [Pseudoxanthomonas jiangsuensis]|uniref:YMGG-like glycine zipper-containing protein n=1 Tax=Pseudoxanthomonas jiangsuensis TaxID=619688 RepID=UPI001391055A|nr:glycine zipper 2TM domain-containing protein [Pseudoxanthomonas jiangsuensis]KAF1698188.1 peptidoglycan-associated outer membrane lipoprotein precursor [Pseudoxanthomonas jiangsuensis]